MTYYRRALIYFLAAVAVQAIGFPLISKMLGLGSRFQAPNWIVIVLVSGLLASIAVSTLNSKPD